MTFLTLSATWCISAAVAIVAVTASSAQAYEYNCGKYSGPDPDITYAKFSVGAAWSTALDQGQYAWDTASGVPTTWIPASSGDGDPMLEVRDGSYAETWWARTEYICPVPLVGDDWIGNETDVRYNTGTTGSLTASNKKFVAIHELGHSLGLDHESMTCSTGKSIMEQGSQKFSCSGTPPWQDDQNGVTDKY